MLQMIKIKLLLVSKNYDTGSKNYDLYVKMYGINQVKSWNCYFLNCIHEIISESKIDLVSNFFLIIKIIK